MPWRGPSGELAPLQIANQVSPPIRQAGAARLERPSQGDWVGRKTESWAHGVPKLLQMKIKPLPFGRSEKAAQLRPPPLAAIQRPAGIAPSACDRPDCAAIPVPQSAYPPSRLAAVVKAPV